jgi:hypothetical protein
LDIVDDAVDFDCSLDNEGIRESEWVLFFIDVNKTSVEFDLFSSSEEHNDEDWFGNWTD